MDWLAAPDYWLTRFVFERALGAVYLVAFLVTVNQFRPLLGERGLLPAPEFIRAVPFRASPTLFHLFGYSDRRLLIVAWTGVALSIVATLGLLDEVWFSVPFASMVIFAALWVLYLSIVNIGQTFYSFGWESLLLETGFLAIFLGPATTTPQFSLIVLLRWLLFRVEFGAGLIKMRGDRCWRDLTCLYYHHETQPMSNPLSWYFHHLPKRLHRIEVLGNHFAQLLVPWFLFFPQPIASLAGLVIILTQSWLLLSGNFAWLNVITITLAVSAFDNAALGLIFPLSPQEAQDAPGWYLGIVLAVTALIVFLSYRPARNLLSRRQIMNASFDPFHIVGTYGAFGSVTKERFEIVIEGTAEPDLTPQTVWREYEFKGKPGDVRRRPPQIAPYHLRLDWLMWFAAMSSPMYHEWFVPLLGKLLEGDRPTLRLLRRDPFDGHPPRFVRALLYLYRFTTPMERRESDAWWHRDLVGDYVPPVSLRGRS
ncbi:MAG: lipase maturation factor family protein [Candidatus Limnocylindria bacterium]